MLADDHERVLLDARSHGIALAPRLTRALLLAVVAASAVVSGWPFALAAPPLLAVAALISLSAVVGWERTRLVVTTDKIYVVHGTFRRRAAGVRLGRAGAIEVEQTPLGRLLRYGTLIAANLEIDFVADPREVWHLVGGTKLEEIELHEPTLDLEPEREPAQRPLRVHPHARRRTA